MEKKWKTHVGRLASTLLQTGSVTLVVTQGGLRRREDLLLIGQLQAVGGILRVFLLLRKRTQLSQVWKS